MFCLFGFLNKIFTPQGFGGEKDWPGEPSTLWLLETWWEVEFIQTTDQLTNWRCFPWRLHVAGEVSLHIQNPLTAEWALNFFSVILVLYRREISGSCLFRKGAELWNELCVWTGAQHFSNHLKVFFYNMSVGQQVYEALLRKCVILSFGHEMGAAGGRNQDHTSFFLCSWETKAMNRILCKT